MKPPIITIMPQVITNIITRSQAKSQGLKWYFTGKLCVRNHSCVRSVATGTCVECAREKNTTFRRNNPNYKKQYYQANREKCLEYNKNWQQNNPDKVKNNSYRFIEQHGGYSEYSKQQRRLNPDIGKTSSRKWRFKNPHKVREHANIRRTSLEYAIPSWYNDEVNLIHQLYQKRTELSDRWGVELEVDHIIPLRPRDRSVSGLHCWHNLQLLDQSINGSKHDQYQTDW